MMASSLAFARVDQLRTLPNPIVRDSSGVRIVEYAGLGPMPPRFRGENNPFVNRLTHLPPAFVIDPKPYLDLGGTSDDENAELDIRQPMLSAVELSNGLIVVNERTRLKFFDRQGRFVKGAGQRGRGPAEFSQIRETCKLRGDSLLVIDFDGRVSTWTGTGAFIRTYARPGFVPFNGCDEQGRLVVQGNAVTETRDFERDFLADYALMRPDGSVIAKLGRLPAPLSAGGLGRTPNIIPRSNEIIVGNARVFELSRYGIGGKLTHVLRLTGKPIPIVANEWRTRAENSIPRSVSPSARSARIARAMAEMPNGAYPAFSSVRVDDGGRIWVQDYEDFMGWTVFDPNFRLLGRLELTWNGPRSRVQLVNVSSDHIVVLRDDDDGAPHLHFHQIRPYRSAGDLSVPRLEYGK